MKLTTMRLKQIIIEEVSQALNEMAAVATIKRILKTQRVSPRDAITLTEAKSEIDELLESQELLIIAQQVRKMVDNQVPSLTIVKYLDAELSGVTKEAIDLGLALATAEQLRELEFEASFGDVDIMSSALQKQNIKDPIDALEKLKLATKGGGNVSDIWLISIQLRTLHEILQEISYKMAELLPGSGPIEQPLW